MSHMCVGSTTDQDVQMSLEEESQQHGDLVQGDFLDTYRNLSYKAIMGSIWVAEFCGQAEFVVKIDDDCFLDLYEVKNMLAVDNQLGREGAKGERCFICPGFPNSDNCPYKHLCRFTHLQESTSRVSSTIPTGR